MQMTPLVYTNLGEEFQSYLTNDGYSNELKYLILGGDRMPKNIPQNSETQFYQAYGLTEMSVWQSLYRIRSKDGKHPIFDPERPNLISGTEILLDPLSNEIIIKSDKRKSFVMENGRISPCERISTGDIGLKDGFGRIYFGQRRENHIKINGKRTNLKEIRDEMERILPNNFFVVTVEKDLISLFIRTLSGNLPLDFSQLPSHLKPKNVVKLESFPLNLNGKIDRDALRKLIPTHQCQNLQDIWNEILFTLHDNDSGFLDLGGDSMKAVEMASKVEHFAGKNFSTLVNLMLNNGTFSQLRDLVFQSESGSKSPTDHSIKRSWDEVRVKRRKMTINCDIYGCRGQKSSNFPHFNAKLVENMSNEPVWSVDLEKCIDASPLITETTVYIGSHAGIFASIDIKSGSINWKVKFDNRIESSALLCNDKIIFGCYDGFLYALSKTDGRLEWKFGTEDIIKCSPVADYSSGFVYFGSYDHHLYCVQAEDGDLVWKLNPAAGSISASPVIAEDFLIVATLNGKVCCLDKHSADKIWSKSSEGPIFSTPGLLRPFGESSEMIVVADVKGTVACYKVSNGHKIWEKRCKSPIFTSVMIVDDEKVLFGDSSGRIFGLDAKNGNEIWKLQFDGKFVSAFWVLNRRLMLAVNTNSEAFILDIVEGRRVAIKRLALNGNAENFSSPVVIDHNLIYARRDNFIYCDTLRQFPI